MFPPPHPLALLALRAAALLDARSLGGTVRGGESVKRPGA